MQRHRKTRSGSEEGIALLIAIFVLLLISVVAIALLVASGTETALGANYRSSSTVYYAALAGLEEVRGRLLPKNPNFFGAAVPSPFPVLTANAPTTLYVLNRLPGENIVPSDPANPYYDGELQSEFGIPASNANVLAPVNSVWDSNAQGIPGPTYKWVRINAVTEASIFTDVDSDGSDDAAQPLYYDPAHLNFNGNPWPSLVVGQPPPPTTAAQVLEITAFAALPNGTHKYLQYLITPFSIALPPFPAAVTLVGNNVDYTGPTSAPAWFGSGNDTINLGNCAPGPPVFAVGYSNNNAPTDTSYKNIHSGSLTAQPTQYPGQGGSAAEPSLGFIGNAIPANFQTATGLNSLVQTIIQDRLYDVLINRNATGADLPSGMSPTNPMTTVINGDLDIANSFHSTGYGLLIVAGNFNYDPDSSWFGIILVIGKGTITAIPGKNSDNGSITGALFVAKTVGALMGDGLPDSADNNAEFPNTTGNVAGVSPGMHGSGIYYSSCWIKAATPVGSFHIISFHEVPQ